jgi:hypothetical protein
MCHMSIEGIKSIERLRVSSGEMVIQSLNSLHCLEHKRLNRRRPGKKRAIRLKLDELGLNLPDGGYPTTTESSLNRTPY